MTASEKIDVMPAQAGIHLPVEPPALDFRQIANGKNKRWTPAFAGETVLFKATLL